MLPNIKDIDLTQTVDKHKFFRLQSYCLKNLLKKLNKKAIDLVTIS